MSKESQAPSLKHQTLSGILWTFIDIFLVKGGSFYASLFLARILGPEAFGLIGMITVFIAIGHTLVESGLSASLIITPKADEKDFSTVFFSSIAIGLFTYFITFLIAPYIALFYDQPILKPLIRVYCLSFIISAFSNVQISILEKEMKFKKQMLYNIPGNLLGITCGILLAYNGLGVWSIVSMFLISQTLFSLMLWINTPWKPSIRNFSKTHFHTHYNYGYKLMLSGLLNCLFENIYNVLIGKFYSPRMLGFYDRANRFNQYPVLTLTGVISKVTFPMLAKIKDDPLRIRETYRKVLQATFMITAPLMLGAAALAEPLFLFVLGKEWLPTVPFFQIICFGSMFYPIHSFNINVLKVFGRSDLFLKLEIMKKGVMVLIVLISFQFGIYGLVWSSVIVSIISLFINTLYSAKFIQYPFLNQIKDIGQTLVVALIMGGSVYYIYSLFPAIQHAELIVLLCLPIVGALLFFAISKLINPTQFTPFLNLLKRRNING